MEDTTETFLDGLITRLDHHHLVDLIRQQPIVLTVPEAAQLLRIGKNRTYELVASGEIRCVKVGRKRLVPVRELLDWLERETRTQKPASLLRAA